MGALKEIFVDGGLVGNVLVDIVAKPIPPAMVIESLADGIELAFCPTGPDGGIDNSCSPANKLSGGQVTDAQIREALKARPELKDGEVLGEVDEELKTFKEPSELDEEMTAAEETATEHLAYLEDTAEDDSRQAALDEYRGEGHSDMNHTLRTSDYEVELASLEEEYNETQGLIEEAKETIQDLNDELEDTDEDAEVEALENDISQHEDELQQHEEDFADLEERLERLRGIEHLTDVIDGSPPIKGDIKVFRGIGGVEEFVKLRPGDIVRDDGFVSTSTSKYAAKEGFASSTISSRGIVMEIKVPKGSIALMTSSAESEVILPRSTRFEITSVRKEEGMYFLQAKVLQ